MENVTWIMNTVQLHTMVVTNASDFIRSKVVEDVVAVVVVVVASVVVASLKV